MTLDAICDPRADAAARRQLAGEIAAESFAQAGAAEPLCAALRDCHHAFAWRDRSRLAVLTIATWQHTIGFRFLHLRAVTAPGHSLPGDWLRACLAEAAQAQRGETPTILAIESSPEGAAEIRRQATGLGGTALAPQGDAASMPAAVAACVMEALAGSAPALPLCVLLPATDASILERRAPE